MQPISNDATQAPELRVAHWIDGAGDLRAPLTLAELGQGYKLLYCFQHWCPGCHSSGFPALRALVDSFESHAVQVGVAVIQTVFEGAETNTPERLRETQQRYGFELPFGHDEGENGLPTVMQDYRTGGTPWFILIDPTGRIVHSDFQIDVERVVESVVGGTPARQPRDAKAPLRWSTVVAWAREGNLAPPRRVEKTNKEWRAQLTEEQFQVTRCQATEGRFSSDMCSLFEPGLYDCACCGTPLFDATNKFESGSGWPSFTAPLVPGVVAYVSDGGHGMQRIEATCNVCDAHLGHVFPDGPEPTGLRYCINAASLTKSKAD